jgi:tetratricopeptide (TPR) repeat protein
MHKKVIIFVLFIVSIIPYKGWTLDDEFGDLSSISPAKQKEARDRFIFGKKHWYNGEYAQAAKYFKELYNITKINVMLYHVGRCYEELKQYKEAVRWFKRYIKKVPEAKTETDANWRIEQLQKIIDEENKKTNFIEAAKPTDETDNNKKLKGVTVSIASGFSTAIIIDNKVTRNYIPVDFMGNFIFKKAMLSVVAGFGHFLEGHIPMMESGNAAEKQFYIGIGFGFIKLINDRFSLYGRFMFNPTWIGLYAASVPITWFAIQANIGGLIHLTKGWSILIEANLAMGPAIVPELPISSDAANSRWEEGLNLYGDAGGRLGIAYTFN